MDTPVLRTNLILLLLSLFSRTTLGFLALTTETLQSLRVLFISFLPNCRRRVFAAAFPMAYTI